MKITKSYLRKLIKETIQEGWENEKAWTVTMRNSETGKTEKVHVWTGAPNEKEAKRIARTSSRYAGEGQWVADAAELKESMNEATEADLVQQLIRAAVKSLRDEGYFGSELRGEIFHKIDKFSKKNPERGEAAKKYINKFGIPGNL